MYLRLIVTFIVIIQEDLVNFLKKHEVHIVASLPCYSAENVDQQRGRGVFERSVAGLLALNEAGYGSKENLHLDLVYNPSGAFLPPPQENLEVAYKKQLADNFGILSSKKSSPVDTSDILIIRDSQNKISTNKGAL